MGKNTLTVRFSPKEFKIIKDFKIKNKFPNYNQFIRKSLADIIREKNTAITNDHILLAKIYDFLKKELPDTPENQKILNKFVKNLIPEIWRKWINRYDINSKRITKYSLPFDIKKSVGRPKTPKRKPGRPKF